MDETPRRILVVSTSRGDARGLRAVVGALPAQAAVTLLLTDVAAPMWGGETRATVVSTALLDDGDDPGTLMRAGHRIAGAVAETVSADAVDVIVVHGDRHELLPVAHAVLLLGVPLVHLGGGDVTVGAFDDSVRKALTTIAHLHLCATEEAAARVRGLGEEPWRVVVTGEPEIDSLRGEAEAAGDDARVSARLGFELRHPLGLLTYHPPTADLTSLDAELSALLDACDGFATVIATHPGAEPRSADVIAALTAASERRDNLRVVTSLGDLYAALLARADVVMGNSSSGMIEAATFCTPVVDIGDRQRGRLRPPNVLHAAGETAAVSAAIRQALDPAFRAGLRGMVNPYGDGRSGARAATAIMDAPLDRLLPKRFA